MSTPLTYRRVVTKVQPDWTTKYKWYNEFLARYPDRDHYPTILKSLVPADGLKLIIRIKGPAPVPAENYPKSCHEIFEQFAQEPF